MKSRLFKTGELNKISTINEFIRAIVNSCPKAEEDESFGERNEING